MTVASFDQGHMSNGYGGNFFGVVKADAEKLWPGMPVCIWGETYDVEKLTEVVGRSTLLGEIIYVYLKGVPPVLRSTVRDGDSVLLSACNVCAACPPPATSPPPPSPPPPPAVDAPATRDQVTVASFDQWHMSNGYGDNFFGVAKADADKLWPGMAICIGERL